MNYILICVIAFIIFLVIFFYIIEPKIMKVKVGNSNEYGSARFSSFSEIKKNFSKEKVSNINEVGFPIWYSKDNKYVWFDKETPHYVYLGSTGSGKSVTAVIPTCAFISSAKKKRSVFITDPKGEIFNATSKMFKDNGYNIFTIDFRNPELSNKINLLEPIIKEYEVYMEYDKKCVNLENDINYANTDILTLENNARKTKKVKDKLLELNNLVSNLEVELLNNKNISMKHLAETNRLITSLSTMIMTDKIKEKDPFWNNSAKNLLEGLISLFLEEYKNGKISREKITLTSIRKFQNSSMDELNFEILCDHIDKKPYGLKSKDNLTSIFSSSENTYKSITATFGEKMALFDDVNVANITSNSDFDFEIFGKEPSVIYIIVPDEDKTYYSLITIIVGLLYRELTKLANMQSSRKLPVQIDWILDEFANCPPLPDIEAIVSVARSRGMRFHFFIQSFSQLDNVYGKEVAKIILDNCGLVYLKTNTQETAEAISKRLGKKTIESNSVRQSVSVVNFNADRSTNLIGRDLLTPEEVKQLHYKTIIFPILGFPIFRDTVLYNKFSCYKSGEIEREATMLKDLSYTYFTVEELNPDIKRQRIRPDFDENEANNFYQELYKDIVNKIDEILINTKYDVEYPMTDEIMYCSLIVDNLLSEDDINRILKLEDDSMHIETDFNDNKTIINIHKIF